MEKHWLVLRFSPKFGYLFFCFLLCAQAALGASSVTITIQGVVEPESGIAMVSSGTGGGGANQVVKLDLKETSGSQTVGEFVERSNSSLGYKVTVQSASASRTGSPSLISTTPGVTGAINYTLQYGGQNVALVNGEAVVTNSSTRTTAQGVPKPLQIRLQEHSAPAGVYADTLTIVVSSN